VNKPQVTAHKARKDVARGEAPPKVDWIAGQQRPEEFIEEPVQLVNQLESNRFVHIMTDCGEAESRTSTMWCSDAAEEVVRRNGLRLYNVARTIRVGGLGTVSGVRRRGASAGNVRTN
jgi:hypothetical protein